MFRRMTLAIAASIALTGVALADPIVGNWRTDSGEVAKIAASGNSFAITLSTGKYSGKRIGQMQANGTGKYKGTITDPADDKTYSGSATLSGGNLAMKGCVAVVFCKTQNWKKQ